LAAGAFAAAGAAAAGALAVVAAAAAGASSVTAARVVSTLTTEIFLGCNIVMPSMLMSPAEMDFPIASLSMFNSMYSGSLETRPLTLSLRSLMFSFPPALTPSDCPIVLTGS
jgi:hypothetical protein